MEIYKVFRKRCIGKNHYVLLAVTFLFFAVMTYHVMNDDRIAFLSLFTAPKRIEAGEDLEKYCRYEVVCDKCQYNTIQTNTKQTNTIPASGGIFFCFDAGETTEGNGVFYGIREQMFLN